MLAEECELSLWINKLSGIKLPRGAQTVQMALGSAVDAFIKTEIALMLGKKERLADLLKNVDKQHWNIVRLGNSIAQEYVDQGCLKTLMDEGLDQIELTNFNSPLPGTTIILGGIPDAAINSIVPADWKVSGYQSKYHKSPTKGYCRLIHNRYNRGRHRDYDLPLEEIDRRWATQLVFYNWIFGVETKMKGAIEQIIINKDKLYFASYRNRISQLFADRIKNKLVDMWSRFKEGKIIQPTPSISLCEPYDRPRMCTTVCHLYKSIFHDDMTRQVMRSD